MVSGGFLKHVAEGYRTAGRIAVKPVLFGKSMYNQYRGFRDNGDYRLPDSDTLVIGISGYWGHSWGDFRPYVKSLHSMEIDFVGAGDPFTNDIEDSIEHVCEVIGREADGRRVILWGYSRGALVGRGVVQKREQGKKVDKLICVASPNRGTKWARAVSWMRKFKSARQMLPGSDFLEDLNTDIDFGETKVINIYGELDRVAPPETAFLEEAHVNKGLPVDHTRILYDSNVGHLVIRRAVL